MSSTKKVFLVIGSWQLGTTPPSTDLLMPPASASLLESVSQGLHHMFILIYLECFLTYFFPVSEDSISIVVVPLGEADMGEGQVSIQGLPASLKHSYITEKEYISPLLVQYQVFSLPCVIVDSGDNSYEVTNFSERRKEW